jgi:hypothetical protein
MACPLSNSNCPVGKIPAGTKKGSLLVVGILFTRGNEKIPGSFGE